MAQETNTGCVLCFLKGIQNGARKIIIFLTPFFKDSKNGSRNY